MYNVHIFVIIYLCTCYEIKFNFQNCFMLFRILRMDLSNSFLLITNFLDRVGLAQSVACLPLAR